MDILFYDCKRSELVERARARLSELTISVAETEDELRGAVGRTNILVTTNRAASSSRTISTMWRFATAR